MNNYYPYSTISTKRVVLKLLTLDYTEEVYQHFADRNITKYMDIESCKSLEGAKEIIQFHLDDSGCRWGIFTKGEDVFIGTCGFHYLRREENGIVAEVGFDLSKSHWGKGIMFEVMESLKEYGFNKMGLYMLDATVEPENERSLQLMERLGFHRAAERKEGLIYYYLENPRTK